MPKNNYTVVLVDQDEGVFVTMDRLDCDDQEQAERRARFMMHEPSRWITHSVDGVRAVTFDMENAKSRCERAFQNGGGKAYVVSADGNLRRGYEGKTAAYLHQHVALPGDLVLARRKRVGRNSWQWVEVRS